MALWSTPATAKVFLTQDEALALAFPDCRLERTTHYLTEAQQQKALELAGEPLSSAIVHRYQAHCNGTRKGAAYFDTHRVRTLAETLMVVVDEKGKVERLEVLSFKEPQDYLPRQVWYEQFLEKPLNEALTLKRRIRGVTGATLTARATTGAVRRALALHQVLGRPSEGPQEDASEVGGGAVGAAAAAPTHPTTPSPPIER